MADQLPRQTEREVRDYIVGYVVSTGILLMVSYAAVWLAIVVPLLWTMFYLLPLLPMGSSEENR